jgi:pimeloyl-ACP methyl ester carboxylesterase
MTYSIAVLILALVALGWTASGFIGAEMARRVPPAGQFVEVQGGRLHYVEQPGDAARPAIVLLHGASSHQADLFDRLAPLLRGARVIAPDRPGLGWSDRLGGREMADPARQAAAVIEALERLGVTQAVLVAHSLAGAMAARIALERPDLVKGLVMLAAVSHPWPGRKITWYYHPAAHPVIGPLFVRVLAVPAGAALMQGSIAGVFAPQQAPPDYAIRAGVGLVLRPASFEANAQDVAGMYDFVERQAPRYGELAMPVVAIAGEEDEVVWTRIHSVGITRQARNGKLIILRGVGHMPHHAVPELIAAEIRALAG